MQLVRLQIFTKDMIKYLIKVVFTNFDQVVSESSLQSYLCDLLYLNQDLFKKKLKDFRCKYLYKSNINKKMLKPANPMAKKLPPKPKPVAFKPQDYARSNIPFNQIQQLKQAFDLFDINQQGRIDPKCIFSLKKELRNVLTSLNMQSKNGTFFHAVTKVEKQGPIDFSKFIQIMTGRTGLQKTRANIKKVFSNFDEQKTGFISQKNLKKIAKDIGLSNLNDKDVNQMIQKADLDDDGLISEQEFYLIMTKKSRKL